MAAALPTWDQIPKSGALDGMVGGGGGSTLARSHALNTSTAAELNDGSSEGSDDLAVGAARNALVQRLVDSLLHDVRNPLNALSINLDVLTEKIRRDLGEVPASQEKNLKVMREQIFRVDGILRQFAEFLAPRRDPSRSVFDVSEIVKQALSVLGHECRRAMVKVRQMIEPDLKTSGDAAALRFLAVQVLLRGVIRAGAEGELDVTLQREERGIALRVRDGGGDPREPFAHAALALQQVASRLGGSAEMEGSEARIFLPLA